MRLLNKFHAQRANMNRMIMRIAVSILTIGAIAGCAKKEARVDLSFPDEFNGKTLDLISFNDSTVIASTSISDGKATFSLPESDSVNMPLLSQFVVDGRVKGYYVVEAGEAEWCDTLSVAKGTPMNNKFSEMLKELNEADEAEDFDRIIAISENYYNANKDNLFGAYFGVEWLKWADPLKVDSLLAEAPEPFKNSVRAKRYIDFAHLRAKTATGNPFADFNGADAKGNPIKFSSLIAPGKFTIVDFMASWCPYCIKDMPKLKDIYSRFKDKGVNIVSVAVRDEPEATAGAIARHGIEWDVVFDAQKRPYDLYGFSGIPHYMLIGPDGKIVARSMKLSDIEAKLNN